MCAWKWYATHPLICILHESWKQCKSVINNDLLNSRRIPQTHKSKNPLCFFTRQVADRISIKKMLSLQLVCEHTGFLTNSTGRWYKQSRTFTMVLFLGPRKGFMRHRCGVEGGIVWQIVWTPSSQVCNQTKKIGSLPHPKIISISPQVYRNTQQTYTYLEEPGGYVTIS